MNMNLLQVNWVRGDEVVVPDNQNLFVFYGDNSSVLPFHWPDYLTDKEMQTMGGHASSSVGKIRGMARAFLRYYCALYLQKPPLELIFHTTESGKPYLPGCGLHFNVSHTDFSFLIAFATKQPVGIDLERPFPSPDLPDVMAYAFSAAEIEFVQSGDDTTSRFYTIWTAKEAYLKATGSGLVDHLPEVDLLASGEAQSAISRFRFHSFFSPGGEIGCLVSGRSDTEICFYHLSAASAF